MGQAVFIGATVDVCGFGIIAGPVAGQQIQFALYDDSGGFAPNNLVAQSNVYSTLTEGDNFIPVSQPVELTPGTSWVMKVANGLGLDVRYDPPETITTYAKGHTLGVPFPQPFGSSSDFVSYDYDIYLRVK